MDQTGTKIIQAANFARSAIAPADECGGDDREAQLERGEQQFRHRAVHGARTDAGHTDVRQIADHPTELVPENARV